MVEATLLELLFTPDSLVELAVRSVISGLVLFVISRVVSAKGGLLSAISIGFLNSVILVFLFQAYIFPLLAVESTDIVTALKTNVLGLVLSYILPSAVWFFLVMAIMRVGIVQAGMIAFAQWLLSLALTYFGVFTFLAEFI